MSEEKTADQPAGDPPADGDDEEEQAWGRLSPRLRALVREELDEAEKRRKPSSAATTDKPAGDSAADATKTEEKPTSDASSRPRRTAAEFWFGGRRSSSS